jgi:hypothetical protein
MTTAAETPAQFPQPEYAFRAYGVELDWIGEDGGMVARGHVSDLRFIAACNRVSRKDAGLTNLWDDRGATYAEARRDVKRLWAIAADPEPSGSDWAVIWANVTEDTPGAFPITVLYV